MTSDLRSWLPEMNLGEGRVDKDMLHGLPKICCIGCRGYVAILRKTKFEFDN